MKEKIVYKLVSINSKGEYKSCLNERMTEHALSYKIGERTVPVIGKIFIFKSPTAAKKFANILFNDDTTRFSILKCKAGDKISRIKFRSCVSGMGTFEKFWAIKTKNTKTLKKFFLDGDFESLKFEENHLEFIEKNILTPPNSHCVDWVIPIEKV